MNWTDLAIGVGFLFVAYLIYQSIKNGPESEKTNWNGPILPVYVNGWGVIILCVIIAFFYILTSLPAQI